MMQHCWHKPAREVALLAYPRLTHGAAAGGSLGCGTGGLGPLVAWLCYQEPIADAALLIKICCRYGAACIDPSCGVVLPALGRYWCDTAGICSLVYCTT